MYEFDENVIKFMRESAPDDFFKLMNHVCPGIKEKYEKRRRKKLISTVIISAVIIFFIALGLYLFI